MKRISRYTISQKLGSGGMGDVYLAEDTSLGRRVAVKILPSQFTPDASRLSRCQSEARIVSTLNHPNILTIFEIGQEDDQHFIVTEFIDGETLRDRLGRSTLSLSEVVDISSGVLAALAEAHAAGVVHRDIKPENVMIRRDGLIKVLDFGLAKRTDAAPGGSSGSDAATAIRATAPGTVLGTVSYMSPEQARGLEVDGRTDLFSLGAMLYEMLTGRVPFEGQTSTDVLAAILQRTPAPMSRFTTDLPQEMNWVVEKALHKDRDERYQTAREMLSDLRRVQRASDSHPGSESETEEVSRVTSARTVTSPSGSVSSAEYLVSGIRKHRRIFGGSVLATLLAAAGLIWFTTRASASIDSVAVLPFANESGDPSVDYIADGVTENLINSLSGITDLRVVPRSSVFRYKGSKLSVEEIAKELGTRAVLTGRLRKQGSTFTVQAELVDAATLSQLWGERFEAPGGDLMSLEQDLARNAASKLRPSMSAETQQRVENLHTKDPVAHDLYLRGRYLWNQRRIEGLRMAIDFFQKAIDRDPNFALAWAGLADVYTVLPNWDDNVRSSDAYPKARAAAQRALALDPALVEPRAALAGVLFEYDHDIPAAEREFRRAIEMNPRYAPARHWFAEMLSATGRHEEAIAQAEAGRVADPLSLIAASTVALTYVEARRPDEALRAAERLAELDPDFPTIQIVRAFAFVQKGMIEESAAISEAAARASGDESQMVWPLVARGRRAEARQIVSRLEKRATEGSYSPYWMAASYATLGDADNTIRWLEQAYADRASRLPYAGVDMSFDPVRSDP
ncbi:MAG TPA: protein kinase, partial [Thermoanaerobaculia bacterium]|nr:protein kinase [Thermoanaerobaculia bacterium]